MLFRGMSIQRIDTYLVNKDDAFPSIGIESERLNECLAEFKRGGFQGVFGSPCFGFHENNLDFLREIPSASRVWFWDCTFESVDGIYFLQDLKNCGVMDVRPGIDFSRFPRLETLVAHWSSRDSGLAEAAIRKLYLWHYNPRQKKFLDLKLPPRLEHLELTWLNPPSLEGIRPLPQLKELQIHRGRDIADLSMLPTFAPRLKKLIVTTCKRLKNYEGIVNHPTLELAIVDGTRVRG